MDADYDDDAMAGEEEILADEPLNDDDGLMDEGGAGGKSEIQSYTQVINQIAKTTKKTFPFLTKYEKTRIIGVRMEQLSNGAKPNISTKGLSSIREIAEEELRLRKTPFIIVRTLPNNTYEYWKIEEFEKI
jgi:DNA-directed RNA polymerase I, II, and III subunit RPABC2